MEIPKEVEAALTAYLEQNASFALARARAEALEFERPLKKDAAIREAIFAADQRGEKLAYTAAERTVEDAPSYADHCADLRAARIEEQDAFGEQTAARLRAEALVRLTGAPRWTVTL